MNSVIKPEIFISTIALMVSIVSLYKSLKINKENWQRSTRLPYYVELDIFTNQIFDIFDKKLIYKVPDFSSLKAKARTYGLLGIYLALDNIEALMYELDKERHNKRRDIKSERKKINDIHKSLIKISEITATDIQKLTRHKFKDYYL